MQETTILFDFKMQPHHNFWRIVDDKVMGGRSEGHLRVEKLGHGVFEGFISTENQGGFSLVKYTFPTKRIVFPYSMVCMHLKGDGKPYQFRIKSARTQSFSYVQEFESPTDWQTICLQLSHFYPTYRGNTLQIPNYDGQVMEEISFFMGSQKKENFVLEIERVWLA